MKKIISCVVAIFMAIILLSNVSAVEVSPEDIPAGSYLIGTHLFDREGSSSYDGTLTVRHIMLASKTITGNSLEDMQILYKRAFDGAWLDSITNEVVEMPAKVNVEYKNLEEMLVAPTLWPGMGGPDFAYLSIIGKGEYASEDMWNSIDGYELYEKDGDEYILIDEYEPTESAEVTADVGEKNVYVARVYKYNNANEKVYSDYSNEWVLEYALVAPFLGSGIGAGAIHYGITYLNIIEDGAYGYEDMWNSIDGYELYEKDGEEYILIGEAEPTDDVEVTADVGEKNVYVARVYKYNDANEKVYSDYSNEYVFECALDTPTLGRALVGPGYACIAIVEMGAYGYEDMWNSIDGYELYEKDGEKLTLIGDYEPTDSAEVTVDSGKVKTFVARVYRYNKSNEKGYSDYSKEFVLAEEIELGDVNDDGEIDIGDALIVQDYVKGKTELTNLQLAKADVSNDSKVDNVDVMLLLGYDAGYYPNTLPTKSITDYILYGDIDNNGIVDEEDVYYLESHLWGDEIPTEQGIKNADVNGDGVINDDDYPIIIQQLVDGNNLPSFEPKENVTKIEYYIFDELQANEYLISVPEDVEIDWDREYQFGDNSVLYDIALFELPNDLEELPRFKGWYLDKEGITKFDETQALTGTIKLYATFDMEFTIVYDGNGATGGTMENSVFTIGEMAKLAKNLYTRDGYKFVAWSNDAEDFSELAYDEEEFEIPLWFLSEAKEPFMLYAVWEKEIVLGDITGEGDINSSDGTKVLRHIIGLEELTEAQLLAADLNLDDEVDYVDYAIIMKKAAGLIESLPYDSGEKYNINYDLDGGSGVLGIEIFPTEYAEVSLPMTLPMLIKDGYVFKGWTGSNGEIPQTEVTITEGTTGNLEYTANWELAE